MKTSRDRGEYGSHFREETPRTGTRGGMTLRVWFALARSVCIALAVVVLASPLFAENHAVLIGVKEYQADEKLNLEGPVNDVMALRETLGKYGFSPQNITSLTDSQATKENILKALRALRVTTKPGDFIFVYFSGHGTSTFDRGASEAGIQQAYGMEIGDSSGALVPYDANEDPNLVLKTLLIGRRDLKPIFLDLDKNRKLFVVFDACFSGNTVRGIRRKTCVPKFADVFAGMAPPAFQGSRKESYPYRNVIYLSAARENEMAGDETAPSRTVDGKAHGVLTDALLRGLRGEADTNHDGVITYLELYDYVRKRVNMLDYDLSQAQTPQLLPQPEEAKDFALSSPVFGYQGPIESSIPKPRSRDSVLRVGFDGDQVASSLSPHLSPLLCRGAKSGCVEIVKDGYDLLVQGRVKMPGYPVVFPSGDMLYMAEDAADLKALLEHFVKVKEIIGLTNPDQTFNVRVTANDGRTLFFNGEALSLTIESERDAWLLILNIDPQNFIGIHRPDEEIESAFIRKNMPFRLSSGIISPPLGCEFMKVIAFLDKRDAERFVRFATGSSVGYIDPGGKQFLRFREMLESSTKDRSGWAEAIIPVVTQARRRTDEAGAERGGP